MADAKAAAKTEEKETTSYLVVMSDFSAETKLSRDNLIALISGKTPDEFTQEKLFWSVASSNEAQSREIVEARIKQYKIKNPLYDENNCWILKLNINSETFDDFRVTKISRSNLIEASVLSILKPPLLIQAHHFMNRENDIMAKDIPKIEQKVIEKKFAR